MTERKLIVLADFEGVARHVADWIVQSAIDKKGRFAISLSGGSTPKRLYQILAEPAYQSRIPWKDVHWFWGDERMVPRGDPLSNYRMTSEALLGHVPVPPENVHGIPTEGVTAEESAQAYEATLKSFYGSGKLDPAKPLFDINLLGIGPDGHTASLFPGTSVLTERSRWVAPVIGAKAEDRITLTYPTLASARHVAFLLAGADKQPILKQFMAEDQSLPSVHVAPVGELLVFTDKAATGQG
jgi:6-phosphogluconolactonase